MPLAPTYTGPAPQPANLVSGNGRAFLPDGGNSSDINVSSQGDNVIVPAIPGRVIYVYAFDVISDTGQQVGWKDGASTFLDGPFQAGATNVPGGSAPSVVPPAWKFRTSVGNALVLNLSQAIHVGGSVQWWADSD